MKQSVTGSGSASKEQVAYMLEKILNMELSKEFMDATDGIAIAICHHYHANSPAAAASTTSKNQKKEVGELLSLKIPKGLRVEELMSIELMSSELGAEKGYLIFLLWTPKLINPSHYLPG